MLHEIEQNNQRGGNKEEEEGGGVTKTTPDTQKHVISEKKNILKEKSPHTTVLPYVSC